eukprot:413701-Pyramimonas_sp.AAC.1
MAEEVCTRDDGREDNQVSNNLNHSPCAMNVEYNALFLKTLKVSSHLGVYVVRFHTAIVFVTLLIYFVVKLRFFFQIRTLACERGLLNRADGSARWSQGAALVSLLYTLKEHLTQHLSSVLAAVYGPKSVPGYKEDPEKAKIEVLFKPKTDLPGTPERELEQVIAKTVESVIITALHPRTGISIILQVLQDDGATLPTFTFLGYPSEWSSPSETLRLALPCQILACAINAACAALVDAGIAMNGLVGE